MTDRDGNAAPISDLGFPGWQFIRVPLGDVSLYNSVEQVRLTFVAGPSGTPISTKVRIGKLAFVGNTWEKAVVSGGTSMDVSAVNNLDNPDYDSLIGNPSYNELYRGSSGKWFTRARAFGPHVQSCLWVHGDHAFPLWEPP